MTETPTRPQDSGFFFGELIKRLRMHPAEVEQRVVAHIRETTGHATLPSYNANGASEESKIALYKELLLCVLKKDFSTLKGTVAAGQALKPVERAIETPKVEPEAPDEPKTVNRLKTPTAPATLTAAATDDDDQIAKIAGLLKSMMGSKAQVPIMDETKIREIATEIIQSVVGDKLMAIQANAVERINAYLAKIPPRDALEIKKWDGTVNEVKGAYHKQLPQIIKALTSPNAIGWSEFLYVYSAPGCGKTHMLRQIAQGIGVQHYPFPCGPTTTEGRLLGFNNIANGTFVPGWLYKPYKEGGVVGLDEVDLADASVLAGANSIENDEFTFGNGETVQRHKDFYLIAFANTIGTGATGGFIRNKLDAATLNRFTHIKLEYDEVLEARICGNEKWAQYVARVRSYVQKNCNNSLYVTPRASRKGAAYLKAGIPVAEVCDMVLFGLCSAEIKDNILKNVGDYQP